MIEKIFRGKADRLQVIYDGMPYPVQNALTSLRGWFLTRNRYNGDMYGLLQQLRLRERWSAEEIAAYQVRSLRAIVEHARRTVSYYAEYPRLEWNTLEDLQRLPVLTRDIVRANADQMVSKTTPKRQCINVGTTGTTGASLKVAYSPLVARHNWAFRMRQWAWAAVNPREPRLTCFGSRVVPPHRRYPPYWTYNLAERQVLISIFHLSESTARAYISLLKEKQSQILEGFPSVLGIMADLVLRYSEPIPMRVVFTDGEPLYPFLREKIEKAFLARIFDTYGNTELCGLIQECEHGQMHLISDYACLEILDDNNRPVPPGQEGYLVWTGFVNDTMPLIRYRIGDRGCWLKAVPCPCGRAFPPVVPTITRDSDLLRCPSGRIFSPRALNQTLKGASGLRFCQLVQNHPGHLLVRAVSHNGEQRAYQDLMTICEKLRHVLGNEMQVEATLAESPIVRAGGKIPLIIQESPRQTPTREARGLCQAKS
jgi:phenylacetate-coenzyme A ligase PaaK-like adenylate-forming protein